MWPFIDYTDARWDVPSKREAFIRIPTWMFRRWPDFMLIGAPKCGTSSLFTYLEQHPDMAPPLQKELHYYSIHYHLGKIFYKANFPMTTDKRPITGEASPSYYWHPHVPMRVKRDMPDVRLVMLMRDPVDRAYSDYWMQVRQKAENMTWEWAVKYEKARVDHYYRHLQDHPYSWSNNLSCYAYQLRGRYHLHVRRWLDAFPRDQLLFITTEELHNEPQETYDRVCEHVGLDPFEPEFRHYNVHKGSYPEMEPRLHHTMDLSFEDDNEALLKLLPDLEIDWGSS